MSGNWSDLRARVLSAIVMVTVGAGAIWAGGIWFLLLVLAACLAMVWELGKLVRLDFWILFVLMAMTLNVLNETFSVWGRAFSFAFLPVAILLDAKFAPRWAPAGYIAVILLACLALIWLRDDFGFVPILWLVGVVVASDVAGYFAGRALGGPKFWPAISPKKTWSGTIAGWVGAALVGLGFVLAGQGGWAMVLLSPFVAFAGQMGDITESWFKRRAGVKDASNLIPGHGGVLDRFDALIFAALLVGGIALLAPGVLGG